MGASLCELRVGAYGLGAGVGAVESRGEAEAADAVPPVRTGFLAPG